jgi:DNA-directed RNA polymerase subunit RPC12/RpoP
MIACPSCGGPVVRRQRNFLQRLVYRAVYRCEDCNRAASRPRSVLTIFKRYAECPRCGTFDLSRLAAKDRIDSTSPNPFRRILKLLGCPLYHCTFCRMQFRDWRGRAPAHRPVAAPRKTRSTTSSA